jgi:hypothetical protein
MQTRESDTIRSEARDRGQPGRRRNLAMSFVAVGLVLGLAVSFSFSSPEPDPVRTRGRDLPLHRPEALAGALRFERPACPVPSRVAGDLQFRLPGPATVTPSAGLQ